MKMIEKYADFAIASENDAFEYLLETLKDTIRTYDFFVAWDKVFDNISRVKVSLNILNSLIGESDVKSGLKAIIKRYPEVVSVIPLLIAVRDTTIKIADIKGDSIYSFAERSYYDEKQIDEIILFAEKCGLLKIISDRSVKNLVDYATGVEVGLDTNSRKNRSGTAMENLTEVYVKRICENHGFRYLAQASALKIKTTFGKTVHTDKSDRLFDFVISTGSKIYLVEVNYYGGGGSKLKSVAGEFKSLFELVCADKDIGFIWVTDGKGWETAKHPLLETFNATDYIMNINMIENGLLEDIIVKGL